jgi:4-oxalocrotonate tautomerase
MPHVIVKMLTGRSEQQKLAVADAVTKAIMSTTGNGEAAVSVSIEDIAPAEWKERVYQPDIMSKPEMLYKKPGYTV